MRSSGPHLNKPQSIINFFARKKIDIICLSEIKISKANKNNFQHRKYETSLNIPPDALNNTPKEGLAILIKKELYTSKTEITHTVPGKLTKIDLEINDEPYSFQCLYAPSQSDAVSNSFFKKLFEQPTHHNNNILIGDFNTVLDPGIDRKDPTKPYQKLKTSKTIRDYMTENNLVDPWRTTFPSKTEFSLSNSRSASRIDYTLLPAHLYHHIAEIEYQTPPIDTDHKALFSTSTLGNSGQEEDILRSRTPCTPTMTL